MRRILSWVTPFLAAIALGCAARTAAPEVAGPAAAPTRPVAQAVLESPALVTASEAAALRAAIVASLEPHTQPIDRSDELAPLEPLIRQSAPPAVEEETVASGSRLPPESIRRIVRQSAGRFRACYQFALLRNPRATGRMLIRFTIGAGGRVARAEERSASLENREARRCVLSAFFALTFPSSADRTIAVDYPMRFSPDGTAPPDPLPNARRVAEPPPPGFAEAMKSGRRATVPPAPVAPAPLRMRGSRRTRCVDGDPLCPDL